MTDDGNFLARWSRRKRDPNREAPKRLKQEKDSGAVTSEVSDDCVSSDEIKSSFDPKSLPPIESIGPGSDVRAFLSSGVPADLTRAALRRLWSSDPKIRDFVGLSENSWDFNAPGAMAGFGPIGKEQVGRVLAQLLGDSNVEAVPSHSTDTWHQTSGAETISGSDPQELPSTAAVDQQMLDTNNTAKDMTQAPKVEPVSQHASASIEHLAPRRIGRALPE